MNAVNWMDTLKQALAEASIAIESTSELPAVNSGKTALWRMTDTDWQKLAELALTHELRWSAGWVEQDNDHFWVHALFEKQGAYLWAQTLINLAKPELPSQATVYPAANRSERHSQDMFGIKFIGHPDNRPWTRHKAWSKHEYPLRKSFALQGQPEAITPPDLDYAFVKSHGVGTYEIPVGPVHAGIIEPGHFRFQAVGELILNLEERLGYVHKGIEKIAEGRTPDSLARLAGRVSGDTTVSHAWAACMAMEQAAGIRIPPRAALLRGILAERERVTNHLGDIGAICNDVAFTFAHMQFSRLREDWLRTQAEIFGHRLLMDCVIPGGVKSDIADADCVALRQDIIRLRLELTDIITTLDLNSSLEDRLYTAGFLSEDIATAFGTVGYVGRASGQNFDVRRDAPYPPYDQVTVKVAFENQGDIASRFWIRYKEIMASMKLIERFINLLEPGEIVTGWQTPPPGSTGLGIVDGWRGEIVSYVRFAAENTISRFYPRDSSQLNWPALEKLVLNNIVPDFPVCNKSLNGSYSGNDL